MPEGKITKDTTITEALKFPHAEEVLYKYGIGCMGCPMMVLEKIGDIAIMHRIDLDKLLEELNGAISEGKGRLV
ncbi:MAG: DUF1858 domain-containing protein [Candidatus Thermoplasmatota archaeon]|nr:DUF1858 domain-containing protein [Candidatus Thermoplasmatota archaeon]